MRKQQKGLDLEKKAIRLEYSGFVIFAAKMVSVVTGLVFAYMLTHELLVAAPGTGKTYYDLWFNVNDLTGYFTVMAGVLPFWAMRFATRGKEGSIKTGILANLTISGIATLIYLLLITLITAALGISQAYLGAYFVVAIWIMETYSMTILEASLQARMPQAIGYGLIVQQIARVILGYVLVVHFHLLLWGAVVAWLAAYAPQIVYYVKLLAQELKQRIELEYVKEWLKGSIINIYNVVGNQIAVYIFILLFIYGGENGRGELGAGATIVNVITYSSFLAYALYPKLLRERKSEDITTSLKMVLMFAIPLTVGAIALSDSYITMLTDKYTDAGPVLIVLALDAFVVVISTFYSSVLYGVENVDEGSRLSLRQLVKSRLFLVFSLPYLHSLITIPTVFYLLSNYARNQPFQAALYVSIINSVARFTMFLILYIIVRKMIKMYIPWKTIAKYVFAAVVMGAILYVIPHPTSALSTLAETAVGGLIYLAVIMAIDEEARALPDFIWKELKRG
jgi:O-antigen/teichoic acid export membrane protein